jgi:hypothetical protein
MLPAGFPTASSPASRRPTVSAAGSAMERVAPLFPFWAGQFWPKATVLFFFFPRDLFKSNQINSNILKFE